MLQTEMFSDKWYKEDFVVPFDKGKRAALRLALEQESRMGRMFMAGGEQRRKILLDRLKMIEMVDTVSAKHAAA